MPKVVTHRTRKPHLVKGSLITMVHFMSFIYKVKKMDIFKDYTKKKTNSNNEYQNFIKYFCTSMHHYLFIVQALQEFWVQEEDHSDVPKLFDFINKTFNYHYKMERFTREQSSSSSSSLSSSSSSSSSSMIATADALINLSTNESQQNEENCLLLID